MHTTCTVKIHLSDDIFAKVPAERECDVHLFRAARRTTRTEIAISVNASSRSPESSRPRQQELFILISLPIFVSVNWICFLHTRSN